MSYQNKPTLEALKAYMVEDVCDTVNNLSKATGKSKGKILELLLHESPTFIKAKNIQAKVEEEHIESLKKNIKL